MTKYLITFSMLLLPGCAVWEQAAEHGQEVQQLGQTATEVGTTVSAFQPQIGLWILAVGGLAIAVGKILSLSKKGDK